MPMIERTTNRIPYLDGRQPILAAQDVSTLGGLAGAVQPRPVRGAGAFRHCLEAQRLQPRSDDGRRNRVRVGRCEA